MEGTNRRVRVRCLAQLAALRDVTNKIPTCTTHRPSATEPRSVRWIAYKTRAGDITNSAMATTAQRSAQTK